MVTNAVRHVLQPGEPWCRLAVLDQRTDAGNDQVQHTMTRQTKPVPSEDSPLEPQSHEMRCRRCGCHLQPGRGDFYVVTVLAIADPTPPVYTEEDLAIDVHHEIQRLLAQLRKVDASQAQDQVYRRVFFHLCGGCYEDWIANPT